MKTLTLTRPDDWHVHVRNGAVLTTVLPHTARQFARAIIMPNLKPPVATVAQAQAYREEILQAIPDGRDFTPLMTLYLTAATSEAEIKLAAEADFIHAVKLYPAGATTHSDAGVGNIGQIYPLLAALERHGLPLLVHGEVSDDDCDIFDRERVFIERHLNAITKEFPALRLVLEHVTTSEAVQFVEAASANVAATITPQHLLFNRNAILAGGIRPHYYCLPVLKRERHRLALLKAATSGNPKFFLGTDSAPHLTNLKETACGCAGCFSAPAALELYAEAFEQVGALDKLEGFASFYGADFYRLPRNSGTVTLAKSAWQIPTVYGDEDVVITPLKSGETLSWKML
ncbi:MAG: dihydroorotase [Methylovulum sp.]|uniref:dihydroorotase n=1 Tax=Methylovulum sp. TaxID=1916980 RepID=UPI002604E71D|nr:dihydroorotase [Methylovulum sp.]MDD2723835.1 dihydroorotase [Methylovulum sp.]MDD5123713.1 dihydroorotase [Methylovulum sp.]